MNNRGYIAPVIKKEDYHSDGKIRLGGLPIQMDGQWDAFLPPDEHQAEYTETQACATFGTLNAVEILERKLFGQTKNWSDRFLAVMSETTRQGNDPHKVAETLRKKGVCQETDWPNTSDLDTWEKFYAEIPDNLKTLALEFKAEYDFAHQYVSPDYVSIKNALMYSPLGVAVFAWMKEGDLYVRPQGAGDVHWCVLYGYEEGKYWKVYDSYPDGSGTTRKRLAWDFGYAIVKEYTLSRNIVNDTFWERFLTIFRAILGYPMDMARIVSGLYVPERIIELAKKITEYEGWGAPMSKVNGKIYPIGTKSWRNKNPGNCRYFNGGYLSIYGNVKRSADNFAVFPTEEQGWLYLERMLWSRCKANPNMTLRQFMATYAPSADGNNPDAYAKWLSARLGLVSPDVKLSYFIS